MTITADRSLTLDDVAGLLRGKVECMGGNVLAVVTTRTVPGYSATDARGLVTVIATEEGGTWDVSACPLLASRSDDHDHADDPCRTGAITPEEVTAFVAAVVRDASVWL